MCVCVDLLAERTKVTTPNVSIQVLYYNTALNCNTTPQAHVLSVSHALYSLRAEKRTRKTMATGFVITLITVAHGFYEI